MRPPSAAECNPPAADNRITADGPLLPVILELAAPSVLMMYLQNAYNIIDTVWVGRLLGRDALAGIGQGGYVLWATFGLAGLISVGLTAIVSRRIGEGQRVAAEQVAARGLRYALVWSLVVAAGVWFALAPLFDLMGASGAMRSGGLDYMRVLLLGAPLLFLSFTIGAVFRAAGDTLTPMWLMALSLLINAGLDPLLMVGVGPLPRLGLAGAALATVIARTVWVALGLWLLARGRRLGACTGGWQRLRPALLPGRIRVHLLERVSWGWSQLLAVVRIGAPHGLSMVLFPGVYMVLVRIPASYGAHQVAAIRIGHTVEGMSFFLAIGVALATAALVGQNLGAGKPARAGRFAWSAAGLTSAVLLVFSSCFFLLDEEIASVFSGDPQTVTAGATYVRILAWSQVFMGLEIVLGGGFNGAGHTLPPMLVAVAFNLARIPLAYALADGLGWGVEGVWWAISGTSIIKGLLLVVLFSTGGWARRQV